MNETVETLNAERATRTNECWAALSAPAAERLKRRLETEDQRRAAGESHYDPFRNRMGEWTEAAIEAVYTGVLGTIVRDLNKGKDGLAVYEGASERLRSQMFPRGTDPIYEEAIEIYRRWDDLDAAHTRALERLAAARAPRPYVPTDRERIAALEAALAALTGA
jgi:hypothetical protein